MPHATDSIDPIRPAWRLERRPHGRLDFIDAEGNVAADVDVLRAFPVSAPAGPVAIVGDNDAELAWIESLAAVEPALRRLLEEELAKREFLPTIERILAVSDGEPAEWSVVTDRGPHRFTVGHADDILRLPDGGAVITDTVGLRYTIPSIARLDGRSRRFFERAE
ncbi:MAG: DUF1854 domain-containing protein [Planctomycetia bacterium]